MLVFQNERKQFENHLIRFHAEQSRSVYLLEIGIYIQNIVEFVAQGIPVVGQKRHRRTSEKVRRRVNHHSESSNVSGDVKCIEEEDSDLVLDWSPDSTDTWHAPCLSESDDDRDCSGNPPCN